MADVRLATTPAAGLRRLGAHGQPVIGMHRQLTAILGNRLGRQHAQLFARPEVSPGGETIDWYASRPGTPVPLAQLPEAERQAAETLLRQVRAEIGQLAGKMQREGGSAELAGHMLELAAITPAGAPVWVVGGQPVMILWGHADEAQAVPDAPAVMPPPTPVRPAPPPPSPPPSAASGPAAAGAAGSAAAAGAAGRAAGPADAASATAAAAAPEAPAAAAALGAAPAAARGGWLPWLLPLLLALLLAWLTWKALQPLPPVVVEHALPAPPAMADPLPAEQEREKALRDKIAALTKLRDERLALCKPLPPPVAPPPPQVTQTEPPKAEPPKEEPPKPQPKPEQKAEAKPVPPKPKPEPPVKPEPQVKKEVAPKPPAPKPQPKAEPKPPEPEPDKDVAMVPPLPPKPAPPSSSDCPTDYPPGKKPMVVFVVDGSGSMSDPIPGGTSRMAAAKDAVGQVVGGLAPPVELGLIDFSDCDTVNNQGRYYYDDRPRMLGQVRAMTPQRGTPLAYSIQRAGDMMTTRGGREATIVVVTDGDDTCPGRGDPCDVARQVRQAKPNVTINVIDLSGDSRGSATARCIAANGGGKVLTPSSAMDMNVKMQQATRLPDVRTCKP